MNVTKDFNHQLKTLDARAMFHYLKQLALMQGTKGYVTKITLPSGPTYNVHPSMSRYNDQSIKEFGSEACLEDQNEMIQRHNNLYDGYYVILPEDTIEGGVIINNLLPPRKRTARICFPNKDHYTNQELTSYKVIDPNLEECIEYGSSIPKSEKDGIISELVRKHHRK